MKKKILAGILMLTVLGTGAMALLRYTYLDSVAGNLRVSGSTATYSGEALSSNADTVSVTVRLKQETKPGVWLTLDSYSTGQSRTVATTGTRTKTSSYTGQMELEVIGYAYVGGRQVESGTRTY